MSWLDVLRKRKNDRGLMADLRCVLVKSKKHRAWPALSRLGIGCDDDVSGYVAGLFATHPDEMSFGNFGTTCRNIERAGKERQGKDTKLTPTERRFQHLLAADEKDELFQRVLRMILMAKSKEVRVNYAQLENDLKVWLRFGGDRMKSEWAVEYWVVENVSASAGEEVNA